MRGIVAVILLAAGLTTSCAPAPATPLATIVAEQHEGLDARAGFANLARSEFVALGAYGFALRLEQNRAPQAAVILAVLLPLASGAPPAFAARGRGGTQHGRDSRDSRVAGN